MVFITGNLPLVARAIGISWWLLLWELGDHMKEDYKDGWPRIPGWYDCLVDGEQMKLKFYVCQVSCKPHWLDPDGNYIETMYKVKWRNENS